MHHRLMVVAAGAAVALVAGQAVAQQPTQAQAAAIRSACRGDYPTHCASVPPGGAAALQCLQQNAAALSAPCQNALAVLGNDAAPPAALAPAPAAPPSQPAPSGYAPAPHVAPAAPVGPAAPVVSPMMSPRQELAILRAYRGPDYRRLCYACSPAADGRSHA
jgi:hypothetical protein